MTEEHDRKDDLAETKPEHAPSPEEKGRFDRLRKVWKGRERPGRRLPAPSLPERLKGWWKRWRS